MPDKVCTSSLCFGNRWLSHLHQGLQWSLKNEKLISVKLAGNLLLISLGLLAIFDILILLHVVPSDIVWGGQIKDPAVNLIVLELIALVVTFIFAIVIAAKMDYIKAGRFTKALNIGVWIIFAYLILNTLGNLASGVSFENLGSG